MFALTISLSEASRSIGLSETELLVKCRNIGMSIYCCPPPSVDIWRFRSITDDHRFGLVGRIVAKEVGPKGGERPGKRFTVEALPPTFVDSAVFFQLSKKDIETLLYTGLVKSRGFAAAYIATEDNCFSLIETGEPNADEIGLLPRKSMVWGRSGPDLPFEGGYCDEFYGMAKSNTTPSGLDDLTDISFLLGDALLERKEFLGRRQLLEPRQTEDILRVFPELSESIGSDNTANPMPKSLVDLLGTCIKAWSMTEPGSTLKPNIAWIKDALAAKSESSFSGEVIDKAFTLCAYGYDYTPDMDMHEWVPDPSRKPVLLVVQENEQLEKQIRRSGLLILVDAWLKCFQNQDLWDDMNKKPDKKAIKAAADDAVAILEAYTSHTVARSMRPVLRATQPWQDN